MCHTNAALSKFKRWHVYAQRLPWGYTRSAPEGSFTDDAPDTRPGPCPGPCETGEGQDSSRTRRGRNASNEFDRWR